MSEKIYLVPKVKEIVGIRTSVNNLFHSFIHSLILL